MANLASSDDNYKPVVQSFLQFDLDVIPTQATIKDAELRLAISKAPNPQAVQLFKIDDFNQPEILPPAVPIVGSSLPGLFKSPGLFQAAPVNH